MEVLIVEDDPFKLDQITEVMISRNADCSLEKAMSAHSAKVALIDGNIDLVLLDMSLPSFDINKVESGGRPLNFGGIDVIRFIRRKGMKAQALVITQFEEFVEDDNCHDLKSLQEYLDEEFPSIFIGIVYFDTDGRWIGELAEKLDSLIERDD